MAQYLVLIYRDETAEAAPTGTVIGNPHVAFMERRAAELRGGAGLEAAETATSIRPDGDGGLSVTDGPFIESKEALGGYYLIEAADLDEALAVAKEVPIPVGGGLEVRPVRVSS